MVAVGSNIDLADMQPANHQQRAAVAQCVEALLHSCYCADAYCHQPPCPKMKRVVIHTRICQRKYKGTCPVCKQVFGLSCFHAKSCREMVCSVPFCNAIRRKVQRRNLMYERLRMLRGLSPDDEESNELDVNIMSRVTGWRLIRIVSNTCQLEDLVRSDDEDTRDIELPSSGSEDSNSSDTSEADNNNVGEFNDSTEPSCEAGSSKEADSDLEESASKEHTHSGEQDASTQTNEADVSYQTDEAEA